MAVCSEHRGGMQEQSSAWMGHSRVEQKEMWDAGAAPGWALHSTGDTRAWQRERLWCGLEPWGTQGAVSCSGQESGAGQELGTPGDELYTPGQAQAHCRAQQGLAPSHDAGDPRLGPVGLSPAASDVNH